MIYTVTLNPALDYHMYIDNLQLGEVSRAQSVSLNYGGKGINVSALLTRLGIPNLALGFAAGITGRLFLKSLIRQGIPQDFILLKEGTTRINVKIHADAKDTDLNAPGPRIPRSAADTLIERMRHLSLGDALVLSGSMPSCLPVDFYGTLMQALPPRILTAIDAEGSSLRATLPLHPFVIKPNLRELEELVGHSCPTQEAVHSAAQSLQAAGAQNVLVSMGAQGAFLLDAEGHTHLQAAPEGTVIQTVGCGDSMLAGFLSRWLEHQDYDDALTFAVACGSATAFSSHLAERDDIWNLYKMLRQS